MQTAIAIPGLPQTAPINKAYHPLPLKWNNWPPVHCWSHQGRRSKRGNSQNAGSKEIKFRKPKAKNAKFKMWATQKQRRSFGIDFLKNLAPWKEIIKRVREVYKP